MVVPRKNSVVKASLSLVLALGVGTTTPAFGLLTDGSMGPQRAYADSDTTGDEAETRIVEMYCLNDITYEQGSGVGRAGYHDVQNLGVWLPANTTLKVRQINTKFNQNATLKLSGNNSSYEKSVTLPSNGSWVTISTTEDTVPFVNSAYRADGEAPIIEFEVEGTQTLPIYTKNQADNGGLTEQEFIAQWNKLNAPYAVYECDTVTFLVPAADKYSNSLGTLDELLQHYDNMIAQYDRFAGLTDNESDYVWNRRSGAKYFCKANASGAGAAYYSGNHVGYNSSSIAGFFGYNWVSNHEFGHGYYTVGGINLGEVWNNVLGYYYQISCRGTSTWLGMTEANRLTYETDREANNYSDSASYATRLYFWVNMLDKLGPQKTVADSYRMYRYNKWSSDGNGEDTTGFSMYANYFSKSSGFNVVPYFQYWGLDVEDDVIETINSAGIYQNVMSLRTLMASDDTADAVKTALGLESRYSFVETQQLQKLGYSGKAELKLDEGTRETLQGTTIKITDGVNVIKEIPVTADMPETTEIDLPVGVYSIVGELPENATSKIYNRVGNIMVTEGGTATYSMSSEVIADDTTFQDGTIYFMGYNNALILKAQADAKNHKLSVVASGGAVHSSFADAYVSIKVYSDSSKQETLLDHTSLGKTATALNTTIDFPVGARIVLYHREAWRGKVYPTANSADNMFATTANTQEFEMTELGLQRVDPTDTVKAEDHFYKAVASYMDTLLHENPLASFKRSDMLSDQKAIINNAFEKFTDEQKTQFKETYKNAFPFTNARADWTIEAVPDQAYTRSSIEPKLTITTKDGVTLTEGTDYTVVYENNVNTGVARAVVYGKDGTDYAGLSDQVTFNITAPTTNQMTMSVIGDSFTYSPIEKIPFANVYWNGTLLTYGEDYRLTYANNKNAGTATVTAVGMGNYKGFTATDTFEITGLALQLELGLSQDTYVANGTARKPTVSLVGETLTSSGSPTITQGSEFDVVYENNVNAGTATVRVVGKGNYEGTSGSIDFTIKPEPVLTENETTSVADFGFEFGGNYNYGTVYFSAKSDLENNKLTVSHLGWSTHGSFAKTVIYSQFRVYDPEYAVVFEDTHYGQTNQGWSTSTVTICEGYIIETYHREVSGVQNVRFKSYYLNDKATPLHVAGVTTTRWKVTKQGLQRIYPEANAESDEQLEKRYEASLTAYMNQLVEENADGLLDDTQMETEKARIVKALSLASESSQSTFKSTFSTYSTIWEEDEPEQEPETDPTPEPEPEPDPSPDPAPDPDPDPTPNPTPDQTPDPNPDTTPDTDANGTPDSETAPDATPGGTPEITPDVTPEATPETPSVDENTTVAIPPAVEDQITSASQVTAVNTDPTLAGGEECGTNVNEVPGGNDSAQVAKANTTKSTAASVLPMSSAVSSAAEAIKSANTQEATAEETAAEAQISTTSVPGSETVKLGNEAALTETPQTEPDTKLSALLVGASTAAASAGSAAIYAMSRFRRRNKE